MSDRPRTIHESHQRTVQMLERKTDALLKEKRAEIEALEKAPPSDETIAAQSMRKSRLDELRVEEEAIRSDNTEYVEYMSAFSNLIVQQTRPSEHTRPHQRAIQGPMGQFVTCTVVQNDGRALREHEQQYAIPLREWHQQHEERMQAGGGLVKKKRVRRQTPSPSDVNRSICVFCTKCGEPMTAKPQEGIFVCEADGTVNAVENIDSSTTSRRYGECVDMITNINHRGGYRKANHLAECLHQRMGRESTHIPQEVIDAFMCERKKHPWMETDDIGWHHMRRWLKKHALSKWYEHIPRIYQIATGRPTPSLDQAQMAKVRAMFQMLEAPFQTMPPDIKGRSNFLSYEYTLFKICELCGYDDMLAQFKLLKSAEKLKNHDAMWKYFCGELNWEFIPTPIL